LYTTGAAAGDVLTAAEAHVHAEGEGPVLGIDAAVDANLLEAARDFRIAAGVLGEREGVLDLRVHSHAVDEKPSW
jgi:hypothetical protein